MPLRRLLSSCKASQQGALGEISNGMQQLNNGTMECGSCRNRAHLECGEKWMSREDVWWQDAADVVESQPPAGGVHHSGPGTRCTSAHDEAATLLPTARDKQVQ